MIDQSTTASTASTASSSTGEVSAASAHKMLIGTAFGILIIVFAILIAGQSNAWGNAMIGFLILILLVQGVTHVSVFSAFVEKSDFLPTSQTA